MSVSKACKRGEHRMVSWGSDARFVVCMHCGAAKSAGTLPEIAHVKKPKREQVSEVLLFGAETPPIQSESRGAKRAYRRAARISH